MMACFNFSRILLFLCMLCLPSLRTKATPTFLYIQCPKTTTYTPNSTYQANLNTLLSVLSSNATGIDGFSNFTSGRNPPEVAYGLFLCRGDVSTDVCKDCVVSATKDVLQRCPKSKHVTIWYDECMLRYSNQTIFSIPDQSYRPILYNTQNITEPKRFRELLGEVMNDTATRASNGDSGKKFATREAVFSSLQTLYGLAQCTPDLSSSDCNTCLRDAISSFPSCCDGRRGGRVLFPSCNVRYELYPFYNTAATATPPSAVLPPPTAPARCPGHGGISTLLLIVIILAIAVSVLLFIIAFCFPSRKAKKKYEAIKEDTGKDRGEKKSKTEIITVESLRYDLVTVQAATKNFSKGNKIGEGGLGEIYKGTLPNGQEIAVKRLSRNSGRVAEEFKNEAVLVAKLQHRNLVRLLGFCMEGEENILIYEFLPNKSLDYFLFDPQKQQKLDWSTRYKIIGGIARGILYLHEDSPLRIIHRDLKTSNILLDGEMNAIISALGNARIFGMDQTQGNKNRVVETLGYMSPEYAKHDGQFSGKSDVFSFGILLLEIISGKKNHIFHRLDSDEDLLSYAWRLWRDGTPLELVDPTLKDSYSTDEVTTCIHIGLLCVQDDPDARPSMATVVLMLNSCPITLSAPQQPTSIFALNKNGSNTPRGLESDQPTSKSMPWSMNETSITELLPR